jgi:hypothetical protein
MAKHTFGLKYMSCLVMVLLLAGCAPSTAGAWAMPARPQQEQVQPQQEVDQPQLPQREVDPWLNSLWFDMGLESQLVGLYNNYAGPRDIARADHISLIDLLDKVNVGHRLVVFKNAADVEQLVPHLVGKIDIIGYNLEGGPANRPDEQNDPIGSIRRVRAVADQYGMQVAFGPDHDIAVKYGPQIAPYADYFILQVQREQTNPQTVLDFVVPLAAQIRQANPNIQISVQIRTEGNVQDLAKLLLAMKGSIDGVSILTSAETAPVAKSLVAELRLPVAEASPLVPTATPSNAQSTSTTPATPATPAKSEQSVAALVSPTPSFRRSAVATPAPPIEIVNPPGAGNGLRELFLLLGLSVMGIIICGVVATVLIYSFRTARGRKA